MFEILGSNNASDVYIFFFSGEPLPNVEYTAAEIKTW